MRGLVIAAIAAIVSSSGCVRPPPQAPVETSDARPPSSAASQQPIPKVTTSSVEAAPPEAPPLPNAEPAPPAQAPAPRTNPPAEPAAANARDARSSEALQPRTTSASAVDATAQTPSTAMPRERTPQAESATAAGESTATARSTAAAVPPAPEETPRPVTAPVAMASPTEPAAPAALDLAGLERRLRETQAIGVFTKLSLKNQVDDLLGQFRAFYRGQLKVQLTDLRQRYELLLFKVLTLLQDSDRELADAIAASREAIWSILSDPQKLARI